MQKETINQDPGFNELLGLEVLKPREGRVTVQLRLTEKHLHGAGQVHGGVYMALLDTAMSRTLHATLSVRSTGATVEMKSNFLRPSTTGTIRAEGNLVKAGKRVNFLTAELLDDQGRLLATASGTFVLVS